MTSSSFPCFGKFTPNCTLLFFSFFDNDDEVTMIKSRSLLLRRQCWAVLLFSILLILYVIDCTEAFTTTVTTKTKATTSSSSSSSTKIGSTTSTTTTEDSNNNNNKNNHNHNHQIVILGGSGRIGTAVAIHLLERNQDCNVILVGRRQSQIDSAIKEVVTATQPQTSSSSLSSSSSSHNKEEEQEQQREREERVSGIQIDSIWDESCTKYQSLINNDADCLIHTAGPYLDEKPIPLKMALQSDRCLAYVDVSDPLSYIEQSLLMYDDASESNLTALVAAGAFPGMSNVLAKEAAVTLNSTIQDVRFNYFTAGLGGSGVVNLYITNLGFGEPIVQYDKGKLRWFMALSGLILGKINFFLDNLLDHPGNDLAKQRIGRQTVFSWPFPEAATVPKNLQLIGSSSSRSRSRSRSGGSIGNSSSIRGNSYAAMGTAPDIWNTMLGILVKLVPRRLWRDNQFSKFMADFSQPLVLATDLLMKQTGTIGETHAMRIDVTTSISSAGASSPRDNEESTTAGVSIVQAHDSFRKCVGQSCAEFALDILEHGTTTTEKRNGVYLPEQYYEDDTDRARIIDKLTSTPGTFCYTGPVKSNIAPDPPSNFDRAIYEANMAEVVE